MAESKQQQENYDDALIHFTNAKRGQCDVQDLFTIMMKLPDDNHVKTLLLAIIYKRYHRLSPEAKATEDSAGGEGERSIFYKAFGILFEGLFEQNESKMIGHSRAKLESALKTLLKIAPLAGGSRDVC